MRLIAVATALLLAAPAVAQPLPPDWRQQMEARREAVRATAHLWQRIDFRNRACHVLQEETGASDPDVLLFRKVEEDPDTDYARGFEFQNGVQNVVNGRDGLVIIETSRERIFLARDLTRCWSWMWLLLNTRR